MKKFKIIFTCFAVLTIICTCGLVSFANPQKYVALAIDVPWAIFDGQARAIDEENEISPYIKNDRTMLPIRFVAESMGADVSWANETVVIKKDLNEIKMKIGESIIYVNGVACDTGAECEIISNRTMVPLRAVAEGLKLNVSWRDGAVLIYEGDENSALEDTIYKDVRDVCKNYSIMPRLVNLSVGGQMIKDFDSYKTDYNLCADNADAKKIHVTAVADKYSNCEVAYRENEIEISVYSNFVKDMKNTYTIHVLPTPDFEVSASSAQSPNYPANTLDKNFETRWAAEGEQWIMYTFKDVRQIDCVKIAFWRASEERKAIFDIYAGNDINNLQKVFSGKSSFSDEELESFNFEKTNAKYLKIVCHGNTQNKWNSILEVEF